MPQEPRALEKVSRAAAEQCGKSWGSFPRFRASFLTHHHCLVLLFFTCLSGPQGETCGNVAVLDTKGLR